MRLLVWFIGVSALVLLTWVIWGGAWEERFTLEGAIAWLEGAGRWAWAAGIGLLVADLVLPVPGTVVMSALGWIYGAPAGGLIASAGSMLAGVSGYCVGRMIGENTARRLLGDADFEKGRRLFSRGGSWMIALSRAVPILPEALSCTAGLVRMPFGRFLGSLACGSLPVGFLFAWVGALGRGTPGWAFAFSIAFPAVLWLFVRRFR